MARSIPYSQEHPMHAARSTLLCLGAPFCIQQFPSRLGAAQKQSRKDPGIFFTGVIILPMQHYGEQPPIRGICTSIAFC